MKRAKVIDFNYVESESITTQGKRREVKKRYPDYRIKEERNGFFVLTKSAKCYVTLSWDGRVETFEMKDGILECYDRTRISKTLFEKFQKDIESGKHEILINEYGYSIE